MPDDPLRRGVRALPCTEQCVWTTARQSVFIPHDVETAQVVAFLSMTGTLQLDNIQAIRVRGDWSKHTMGLVSYRHHEEAGRGSLALESKLAREIRRVELALGGKNTEEWTYWLYENEAEKLRRTGVAGNGHFDGQSAIHSIWPVHSHEVVHLLASRLWGSTDSNLLREGLAVFHSGGYQTSDPTEGSKGPEPLTLADLERRFRTYPEGTSYPLAGELIRWLYDMGSTEQLKSVYLGEGPLQMRIGQAYGVPPEELEMRWREFRSREGAATGNAVPGSRKPVIQSWVARPSRYPRP